ncbi:MAG: hypothetical protein PHO01_07295 [Desulfotomaculaceae bacterium]|nr:hypothetical protein [Desulfotomaculaceae bacterium]
MATFKDPNSKLDTLAEPGCSKLPGSKGCPRCNNLLQNPSFEAGLNGWETSNVIVADNDPFEGTQVARMLTGVASMFQDVPLANTGCHPLFLSFNAYAGSDQVGNNGNLVAEVLWLDKNMNVIATGLRAFIPNGRIDFDANITYFDITDRPPAGAAWARLQFSKGVGAEGGSIDLDQVILAAVKTVNLVQNPGFELGLTGWTTTTFSPGFLTPFEGAAYAVTQSDGTLSQDVPIKHLQDNSSFLFSFAATTDSRNALTVQVQWLDAAGNQIGPPGLDLSIPARTLELQGNGNYLTYLDITDPAPAGAVTARILFEADITGDDTAMLIDQVLLAKTCSTNLVQNPGFEAALDNWNTLNTTLVASDSIYEGNQSARIASGGGMLFQDITITPASGRCFLFNFGYSSIGILPGNLLAEVHWLDGNNRVIGLGLSLFVSSSAAVPGWLVYTGITEPAPAGTVKARVQFTKSSGGSELLLDQVVLGRLV